MENPFDLASKRIKAAIEDASNSTCRKWEDLPINCLVLILKKVDISCLTVSVPFMCKAWYEASLDPACWKVLDLRTTDLLLPDSHFAEDFKRAYCVNKFSLRGFLKCLIRRSNNLATHLFTGDIYITTPDMILLYEECPELHIISWNTVSTPELLRQYFLKIHAIMTSKIGKGGESRRLLEATEAPPVHSETPALPKPTLPVPKVELPPLPEIPKVELPPLPETPKVELPPLPETPKVELPPLPETPKVELPPLPEHPKVELPPLPEIPKVELPPLPETPKVELPPLPEIPFAPPHAKESP